MKKWRLLLDPPTSSALNMGIDETLLSSIVENGSLPTLRFYGWSSPTLSVGQFQRLSGTSLLKKAKALKLAMVRRPTGGRAVLHQEEITYALAIPLNFLPPSVKESSKEISGAIFIGLKKFGLKTNWLPGKSPRFPRKESPSFCFAEPAPGELGISGKKLLGSAQLRKKNAILQHGSLLLSLNQELHTSLFSSEQAECAGELQPFLPSSCSKSTLIEALAKGFEEKFHVKLQQGELSEKEKTMSHELAKTKYENPAWTFSR